MKRLGIKGEKPDSILSPLEQDVLGLLWTKKKMRVREIHSVLKKKRKVALCSVAVTLDRLHEKKVVGRQVERARGGARYIYYASSDQETFEKKAIEVAVDKFIEQFGITAVSYFNERFGRR
ncbi:MAG: hypothetical protein EPN86_05440 [Nanoarchaeota archaeon]|nr:MAG: hypothetical protein EPN86_05440 [Nanoarchaeota archaeon]